VTTYIISAASRFVWLALGGDVNTSGRAAAVADAILASGMCGWGLVLLFK
jgi:hypothetical protein